MMVQMKMPTDTMNIERYLLDEYLNQIKQNTGKDVHAHYDLAILKKFKRFHINKLQ